NEITPVSRLEFTKLKEQVRKRLEKNDVAHDFEHIMRVLKNATTLAKKEKANVRIITAAVLLHDIISYPKSDPRSINSSVESAQEARRVLKKYNFNQDQIDTISDAIRDH